jgi:hypothetical protein
MASTPNANEITKIRVPADVNRETWEYLVAKHKTK